MIKQIYRYTLNGRGGVLGSTTRELAVAQSARTIRDLAFAEGVPSNIQIGWVMPMVDVHNPNTGRAGFDALVKSELSVFLSGDAKTATHSSIEVRSPTMTPIQQQRFDVLKSGLPGEIRNQWEALITSETPIHHYLVCRVHSEEELGELTHGWILATGEGKFMARHDTHVLSASKGIMDFYTKAFCFGEWEGERLVDIQDGRLVYAAPEVLEKAEALGYQPVLPEPCVDSPTP